MATREMSIKDLIRSVHQELIESDLERQAKGLAPLFEVDSLTIELNFVVANTRGAKGGLDIKLISVGGSKEYSDQEVQKITLHLKVTPASSAGGTQEPGKKRGTTKAKGRTGGSGSSRPPGHSPR